MGTNFTNQNCVIRENSFASFLFKQNIKYKLLN
jgi:hypothetical protein